MTGNEPTTAGAAVTAWAIPEPIHDDDGGRPAHGDLESWNRLSKDIAARVVGLSYPRLAMLDWDALKAGSSMDVMFHGDRCVLDVRRTDDGHALMLHGGHIAGFDHRLTPDDSTTSGFAIGCMPAGRGRPPMTAVMTMTDNGDELGLDGTGSEPPASLRRIHDGAEPDGYLGLSYRLIMEGASWERAWGADATGINDKACLYRNEVRRFCGSDDECARVLSVICGGRQGFGPYEWPYKMLSRLTRAVTGYPTGAGTGRDSFLRALIRDMDALDDTNRVTTLDGPGDRTVTILNLAKASARTGDAHGPAMAAALLTTMPDGYGSSRIDEVLAMLTTSMAEDPALRRGGPGDGEPPTGQAGMEELAETARRADALAIRTLRNPEFIRTIAPDPDGRDDPLARDIHRTITGRETRLRRAAGRWTDPKGAGDAARPRLEEDLRLERNRLAVLTALDRLAGTASGMPTEILIEEWADLTDDMPRE